MPMHPSPCAETVRPCWPSLVVCMRSSLRTGAHADASQVVSATTRSTTQSMSIHADDDAVALFPFGGRFEVVHDVVEMRREGGRLATGQPEHSMIQQRVLVVDQLAGQVVHHRDERGAVTAALEPYPPGRPGVVLLRSAPDGARRTLADQSGLEQNVQVVGDVALVDHQAVGQLADGRPRLAQLEQQPMTSGMPQRTGSYRSGGIQQIGQCTLAHGAKRQETLSLCQGPCWTRRHDEYPAPSA